MQEILIVTLSIFTVYIYYVLRKMKQMTEALQCRERIFYMRIVISDKNPNDLYAQPYHPMRGSIIVSSKPDEIAQKINQHFNITEYQNIFIEHVQPLN